jgi:hypothetical protein
MKRIIAAIALAFVAALAVPSAAFAASYTSDISANSAQAGVGITYHAYTGAPNQTGSGSVTGSSGATDPIVTASAITVTTNATGVATIHFTIPTSAKAGQTFTAVFSIGGVSAPAQTVTVVAPLAITSTSGSPLAFTGVQAVPYFWFGGGLVIVGIALIVVMTITRRSRKSA